jgi:hypothetical protein
MTTYHINIDDSGNGVITVEENGEVFVVSSTDPAFAHYMNAALENKPLSEVRGAGIPHLAPLTELSERLFVNENRIEFDGEPIATPLAETIRRYWLEGRPYSGLVKFMERLSLNTCEHSREALWDWVRDRDLEVDNQGLIIAYKGVRSDLTSVHSGPAMVDDVPQNGHIPNQAGSVISMERSQVQHDPSVACGFGLHVGTKSYARGFGAVLLTVLVDPVDVVSVPSDSNGEKMRVCRYEIIDIHDPEKEYEPVPSEAPGEDTSEAVEEKLVEAVPEDAKSYIRRMVANIRRNRRQ